MAFDEKEKKKKDGGAGNENDKIVKMALALARAFNPICLGSNPCIKLALISNGWIGLMY